MKDEWIIETPHHHCFWLDTLAFPILCNHEENSTYCSEDYCPIKKSDGSIKTPFRKHLEKCAETARSYPSWKHDCLRKAKEVKNV